MKRKEFLLDMLGYYTQDTNRRCVDDEGGCKYHPSNVNKEGVSEGCAIGRYLDKESAKLADELGYDVWSVLYDDMCPSELRDLGEDFLDSMQVLHDVSGYWNDKGLSLEGTIKVQDIMRTYKIRGSEFDTFFNYKLF